MHSPYAYRFITDVLKPGNYGFYAYDQLEFLSRGKSIERGSFFRNARFLVRLVIFLKSKRIVTLENKNPVAQIVARALKITYYNCESLSKITFKPNDLLIVSADCTQTSIIREAIEANVTILAVSPSQEIRNVIKTPVKNGVLFFGKNNLILIPRHEMEYVSYSISI